MCNNSLFYYVRVRRRFNGAKFTTEDADAIAFSNSVVGELFMCSEVHGASRDGAHGSDNVGMSNHKSDEISDHRKSKVSLAMTISQGLGGPNPVPVFDENSFNITEYSAV